MNLLPPPGPARTRQLALLGMLLVGVAGAWVYMNSAIPTATPAPTSNSAVANTTAARAAGAGPVGLPAPLKLAALSTGEGSDVTGTDRDPFRFGQPPPPPAPPYRPPPPPPPPPPPAAPTIPEIPLQLILLETLPGNVRTATLKDTATSAVIGPSLEGQVLDGRYRLVKIGLESVVVAYLDGTGQRTLPLGR